jgi:hypothetical protein
LVYQQASKVPAAGVLSGKNTKRGFDAGCGNIPTERLGDIEKYINSDFELVAETSLQAFTNPINAKGNKGNQRQSDIVMEDVNEYFSPNSAD